MKHLLFIFLAIIGQNIVDLKDLPEFFEQLGEIR